MMKKSLAWTASLLLAACSGSGGGGGSASPGGEPTKSLSIEGTFASLPSFVQPLYSLQVLPAIATAYKVRCVTL